jgi:hypothetical protein
VSGQSTKPAADARRRLCSARVIGLAVNHGRCGGRENCPWVGGSTTHAQTHPPRSELSSIPHISWSEPTVQGSVNPSFHTGTRSSYGGQATRMPAESSGVLGDWALQRSRPIAAIACVASPLFIHPLDSAKEVRSKIQHQVPKSFRLVQALLLAPVTLLVVKVAPAVVEASLHTAHQCFTICPSLGLHFRSRTINVVWP